MASLSPRPARRGRVYVAIHYHCVVVVLVPTRADAVTALRAALPPDRRREIRNLKYLSHVGAVYWSAKKRTYWYRFPGDPAPKAIHPKRLAPELAEHVPDREPDRPGMVKTTSAAAKPRREK